MASGMSEGRWLFENPVIFLAQLAMAGHGLPQFSNILAGEPGACERKHDRVLPVNMTAIAFEEAPQHVPHHVGVLHPTALAQNFEAFEKFGSKALVCRVLKRQAGKNIMDAIVRE